jgi:hypothetical protein
MAKFFIVMESKHVTAADRMTQFYMRTFLRNNPSFSNQGSKDDSRLVRAIRSSRYVEDADRVGNVFGMLNIIRNRINDSRVTTETQRDRCDCVVSMPLG